MPSSSTSAPSPSLIPQGRHSGKPPLPITRPFTLIGGRNRAHFHLLSKSVSKCHAGIIRTDHGLYIRDLASREKVVINGQPEKEAMLRHGDYVVIGSFTFQFYFRNQRNIPGPSAPDASVAIDGANLPVAIEGRTLLIGRRPTCDLHLLEASVSTTHAIIFELNGGRYIRDLGSRTGTFVNGQAIHQQPLEFGDTIRIGETTLHYVPAGVPSEDQDHLDELEDLVGTARLAEEPEPLSPAAGIPLSITPPELAPVNEGPIPLSPVEDEPLIPLAPAAGHDESTIPLTPIQESTLLSSASHSERDDAPIPIATTDDDGLIPLAPVDEERAAQPGVSASKTPAAPPSSAPAEDGLYDLVPLDAGSDTPEAPTSADTAVLPAATPARRPLLSARIVESLPGADESSADASEPLATEAPVSDLVNLAHDEASHLMIDGDLTHERLTGSGTFANIEFDEEAGIAAETVLDATERELHQPTQMGLPLPADAAEPAPAPAEPETIASVAPVQSEPVSSPEPEAFPAQEPTASVTHDIPIAGEPIDEVGSTSAAAPVEPGSLATDAAISEPTIVDAVGQTELTEPLASAEEAVGEAEATPTESSRVETEVAAMLAEVEQTPAIHLEPVAPAEPLPPLEAEPVAALPLEEAEPLAAELPPIPPADAVEPIALEPAPLPETVASIAAAEAVSAAAEPLLPLEAPAEQWIEPVAVSPIEPAEVPAIELTTPPEPIASIPTSFAASPLDESAFSAEEEVKPAFQFESTPAPSDATEAEPEASEPPPPPPEQPLFSGAAVESRPLDAAFRAEADDRPAIGGVSNDQFDDEEVSEPTAAIEAEPIELSPEELGHDEAAPLEPMVHLGLESADASEPVSPEDEALETAEALDQQPDAEVLEASQPMPESAQPLAMELAADGGSEAPGEVLSDSMLGRDVAELSAPGGEPVEATPALPATDSLETIESDSDQRLTTISDPEPAATPLDDEPLGFDAAAGGEESLLDTDLSPSALDDAGTIAASDLLGEPEAESEHGVTRAEAAALLDETGTAEPPPAPAADADVPKAGKKRFGFWPFGRQKSEASIGQGEAAQSADATAPAEPEVDLPDAAAAGPETSHHVGGPTHEDSSLASTFDLEPIASGIDADADLEIPPELSAASVADEFLDEALPGSTTVLPPPVAPSPLQLGSEEVVSEDLLPGETVVDEIRSAEPLPLDESFAPPLVTEVEPGPTPTELALDEPAEGEERSLAADLSALEMGGDTTDDLDLPFDAERLDDQPTEPIAPPPLAAEAVSPAAGPFQGMTRDQGSFLGGLPLDLSAAPPVETPVAVSSLFASAPAKASAPPADEALLLRTSPDSDVVVTEPLLENEPTLDLGHTSEDSIAGFLSRLQADEQKPELFDRSPETLDDLPDSMGRIQDVMEVLGEKPSAHPDAPPPQVPIRRAGGTTPPRPKLPDRSLTTSPFAFGSEPSKDIQVPPLGPSARSTAASAFNGLTMTPGRETDVFSQPPASRTGAQVRPASPVSGRARADIEIPSRPNGVTVPGAVSEADEHDDGLDDAIPTALIARPTPSPSPRFMSPLTPLHSPVPESPAPRTGKWLGVALPLLLLLAAGTGVAIWLGLGATGAASGFLRFTNLEKLSIAERKNFELTERQTLAKPQVRSFARQVYETRLDAKAGEGFLYAGRAEEEAAFSNLIAHATIPPNSNQLVMSLPSKDPVADSHRLSALIQALYRENEHMADDAASARQKYEAARDAVEDANLQITRLHAAIESEKQDAVKLQMAQTALNQSKAKSALLWKQWDDDARALHEAQAAVDQLEGSGSSEAATATPGQPAAPPSVDNDTQVKDLSTQLLELNKALAAMRTHHSVSAENANKALDDALSGFRDRIGSAQKTLKEGSELSAYLVAAQQAQDTIRQLNADLVERQKAERQRLADLRRVLAEKQEARLKTAWANDPQLKQMEDDLQVTEHRYNAAVGSGLDADAAKLRGELDSLKRRIDARRDVIGSGDIYADEVKGLQQFIDESLKQMETDRTRADQRMGEMLASLSAAAPKIEKLPTDQKSLAEDLEKQLEQINDARRLQAQAVAAANPESDSDIKKLESSITELQAKLDARRKQLADQTQTQMTTQQSLQRIAALADARAKLVSAKEAENTASLAVRANKEQTDAAYSTVEGLKASASKLQADQAQLMELEASVPVLKVEAERSLAEWQQLPAPETPTDDNVSAQTTSDPRPLFITISTLGYALLALLLMALARHRPRANASHPRPELEADERTVARA